MMGKAILHIPHYRLLEWQPLKYWINAFESMSGRVATDIALPAVSFRGPHFPSEISVDAGSTQFESWVKDVRIVAPQAFIWGVVDASLPFVANEMALVRDQFRNTVADHSCISNPAVQSLCDVLVRETVNLGVDGIAFDVTDNLPQSTGRSRAVGPLGLQHTCFCHHCLDGLSSEGYTDGPLPFMGRRNPFRLVLRTDEDGVANLPVDLAYSLAHPDALLEESLARGFASEDDTFARSDLDSLLQYLSARARVVAKSVRRLTREAKRDGQQTRVSIILGSPAIDLTTMTDMDTLVSVGASDEYWCVEIQTDDVRDSGIAVCQYLFRAGFYAVKPTFYWIDDANYMLRAQGSERYVATFRHYLQKLELGNLLTNPVVRANEDEHVFQGFVGVPLSLKDVGQLGQRLLAAAASQVNDEQ